jgi:hypothetical protein
MRIPRSHKRKTKRREKRPAEEEVKKKTKNNIFYSLGTNSRCPIRRMGQRDGLPGLQKVRGECYFLHNCDDDSHKFERLWIVVDPNFKTCHVVENVSTNCVGLLADLCPMDIYY